jgi:hypothetical protein
MLLTAEINIAIMVLKITLELISIIFLMHYNSIRSPRTEDPEKLQKNLMCGFGR